MQQEGGAVGWFGHGTANERGEQLIHFSTVNNLIVTNTCFRQSKANRLWTWESPDGYTHNQIGYIIVNRKWSTSVINSRAFPSADVGLDHQLVMTNFRLKLKKRDERVNVKRFDVKKLRNTDIARQYRIQLQNRLIEKNLKSTDDVESTWIKVKATFNDTSREVLGFVKGQRRKDWISADTYALVDERKALKPYKAGNKTASKHYNFLCREIRRHCKTDKEVYVNEICHEVEDAQMQKKSKKVFDGIRKIQNKHSSQ